MYLLTVSCNILKLMFAFPFGLGFLEWGLSGNIA